MQDCGGGQSDLSGSAVCVVFLFDGIRGRRFLHDFIGYKSDPASVADRACDSKQGKICLYFPVKYHCFVRTGLLAVLFCGYRGEPASLYQREFVYHRDSVFYSVPDQYPAYRCGPGLSKRETRRYHGDRLSAGTDLTTFYVQYIE